MPLHDFHCRKCDYKFEQLQSIMELKEVEPCPKCGEDAGKVWTQFVNVRTFKPGWYEHIDTEPIYIESKEQLRKECEKRGLYSIYVEDSYNRRF